MTYGLLYGQTDWQLQYGRDAFTGWTDLAILTVAAIILIFIYNKIN